MTHQQLRELCAKATPGPWESNVWIETDGDEWRATGPGHDEHASDYGSEPGGPDEQAAQADAAFIAAARTAVPALLDECDALRAALREALEIGARLNHLDGYSAPDADRLDELRSHLDER